MSKRLVKVVVGLTVLAVPVVAYALTLIASQMITNAHYAIDGNTATAATPATASLQYCPAGFAFLGNRCLHVSSGTEFYGYEIIEAVDPSCNPPIGVISRLNLLHAQTAGSGPAAQTHIYISNDGGTNWYKLSTVVSSTSPTWWQKNIIAGSRRILLGKSTASLAPPTGPSLNWYELTVQACLR